MRYLTEQMLIDVAVDRLATLGIEVHEGVPCLSRCIDLLLVSDETVLAIEFKLRDWRRALDQARDHLLAVDKAYVCLPPRKVSSEMEQAFVEANVGLLFFSVDEEAWPFKEVVPAPMSDAKWEVAERWLTQVLEARRV